MKQQKICQFQLAVFILLLQVTIDIHGMALKKKFKNLNNNKIV